MLICGALFRGLIALRQSDLKSLVAYSSVRHMGFLAACLLLFSPLGFKGVLIITLAHGFCSSALFFLVNFFYERVGSRQILNIRGFQNIFYGLAF